MASDPITGLPAAVALTGTDPLVTVQGGVTVQSDVDAMKAFIDASPTMTFKGQADASAVDEDAATGTSTFQNGDVYRINVAASAPHAFSDISEDLNIGDWVVFNGSIFQKQDGTDPTAAETKTAYESNADTNAFDDAAVSKLGGIEALADVTDTANVTAAGALMDSEVDADLKTLALPANTTISGFGASLVDDANASTARATLGVDAAGTDNSTDVTLAGTPDYITISGQVITRNAIDLTTDITGDLPVADGGTGSSTAAGARTNLSLVIGTDVQAFSSVLQATTASFLIADETKLDGIEALADITDTANVDASGAVMETDFNAQTILLAVIDDTPLPLTIAASTFFGRKATGNAGTMTTTEARTLLNVEDGAQVNTVDDVFGRTGNVVAAVSDYDASQIDNDSDVTGVFVSDALSRLVSKPFTIDHLVVTGEFSVASQSTAPSGLFVRKDGLQAFVSDFTAKTVHRYSFGTKNDPASLSFDTGQVFTVGAELTNVQSVSFSVDGKTMFLTGSLPTPLKVQQYDLSVAWDLTTAVVNTGKALNIDTESNNPRDTHFREDGLKFFIADQSGTPSILAYTMTLPFDLGTASFDSVTFDVSAQITSDIDVTFSDDGFKMFVGDNGTALIFEYVLTTAFLISTATFTGTSASLGAGTNHSAIHFNEHGSKLFAVDTSDDKIKSFEVSVQEDNPFTDAEKTKLAGISYAERTASAKQTITGAGALVLAHNLPGTPTLWYVILENKETEHNFSPGDQARPISVQSGSGDQGVGIVPDGSDLNIRYGSGFGGGSSVFSVVDKITGDVEIITNSKWEAIFVAAL